MPRMVLAVPDARQRGGNHVSPTIPLLSVAGSATVWSTTPPEQAAAYASGVRTARLRLWLEWKAKDVAKRGHPGTYQLLRRLRARSS